MKHTLLVAGRFSGLLVATLLITATTAHGQLAPSGVPGVQVSIGPQVTTLGIGAGATVRIARMFGASAEYHFAPGIPSYDKQGFGNTLTIDNSVQGGMVMALLYPTGGSFAIGAGLMLGGANSDMELDLDPSDGTTIDLGNNTYPVSGVGTLTGDFEYGGLTPVLAIGLMGDGLNLALGAALGKPTLDLSASGPLSSNTAFQADLDAEIEDTRDNLDKVPVYPYIRIGWRFGL